MKHPSVRFLQAPVKALDGTQIAQPRVLKSCDFKIPPGLIQDLAAGLDPLNTRLGFDLHFKHD